MNKKHYMDSTKQHPILKRAFFLIFELLFGMSVLLISSGDFAYQGTWILGGLYLLTYIVFFLSLPKTSKEARAKMDSNRPTYEKILQVLMLFFGFGTYVVAGLDYRYQWTSEIPLYMLFLAIFIFILGMGITLWAMIENPFFNKQISKDENHMIIKTGPYAVIRHPGYLGMMTYLAVTPIILLSMFAMIPTLILILLMIVRTYLEDSFLANHSIEYKAYQKQVKNKLFKTYKS